MQMSRIVLSVAVLCAVTAAHLHARPAVASAPDTPVLFRSTAQKCAPLTLPKGVRAVDALFDSSALMMRLKAVDTLVGAEAIVSVSSGPPPTADVLDVPMVTPGHQMLVSEVIAVLRADVKDTSPAFRLHIRNSAGLQVTLEPSEFCPPVSVSGPGAGRPVAGTGRVVSKSSSGRTVTPQPRNIQARFDVDASGVVSGLSIGAATGIAEVDRQLRDMFENMRYSPATLDGKPVAVRIMGNKIEVRR